MGEAGIDFIDMDELSATTGEIFHDAIFYDDVTMEPFLVFHEVVVDTAWRRRGVGRGTYSLHTTFQSLRFFPSEARGCTIRHLANPPCVRVLDLIRAVHDKVRAHFGHGFHAFAAPGHLGAEVEREAAQQGLSLFRAADEDKMLEIQGRQLDVAGAFWGDMGYKKMSESLFWEVLIE